MLTFLWFLKLEGWKSLLHMKFSYAILAERSGPKRETTSSYGSTVVANLICSRVKVQSSYVESTHMRALSATRSFSDQ